MIVLSFSVRNHGSIRDEVTLDLARPSLRTLTPKGASWQDVTFPLAGVFGGNATGKSALIEAVVYFFSAISQSATEWQSKPTMPRRPFWLDDASRSAESMYELEFVYDGRRHVYGFEVDDAGIKSEWLRDVPSLRWRTLLDREREDITLPGRGNARLRAAVTPRELVLSRALLMPESPLHAVAEELITSFESVAVTDAHRKTRLSTIADALAQGDITTTDLLLLMQVADIGIAEVDIEEANVPDSIRQLVAMLRGTTQRANAEPLSDEGNGPDRGPERSAELDEADRAQVVRRMLFRHHGAEPDSPMFSIYDESNGTLAWLSVAVPALEALRSGGLLTVDEIDASLHPHLLDILLGAFADPEVNVLGAQLVFTSHAPYVLSPLSDVTLEPEQVWLTDKGPDGATELFCLADFPRHSDANIAKRYLTGRYGGVPRLSPATLAALARTSAS